MSFREGPEDLTLRTEEVRSKKSCISVDHISQDRWGPPLVDADWPCIAKVLKVQKLYDHYKRNESGSRCRETR